MNKAELRKAYLKKRQELSEAEVEKASKSIADRFFQIFDVNAFDNLHLFLPIKDKKEVNTWHIINGVKQRNHKLELVVPKTDFASGNMFAVYLKEPVVINKWGIPEPESNDEFPSQQIQLMIVPVLVCDKQGNRIGYGKGFYDKFLATCNGDLVKVGVSLFAPVEKIESEPFDVALNYLITPEEVYHFK